jgi:hypothetical protein
MAMVARRHGEVGVVSNMAVGDRLIWIGGLAIECTKKAMVTMKVQGYLYVWT